MKIIKTYKLFESSKSIDDIYKYSIDRVFESAESVESICNKYGIKNWTLNGDGTVDVDGDVNLYDRGLDELPLKFGRVTGYFYCAHNKLTSLEGSPKEVGGDFDCEDNKLTSLVGSPNWVGVDFNCHDNKLTSLEGCPNWVGGNFYCLFNKLTSLEGCPNRVGGNFYCPSNNLTSLEGCPEKIFGDLYCGSNKIHSLEYYPTILTGQLLTGGNPIDEIWYNVRISKPNNHGVLLELFWLNNPIRYENGEWVCYREFLDNFFEEIGVTSPPKLRNYKEV